MSEDSTVKFIRGPQDFGTGFEWKRENFDEVLVGAEGKKGSLEIINARRKFGGLFEKEVSSLEQAKEQSQKYLSLVERDIPTFQLFKVGEKKTAEGDTQYVVVSEDRSLGGKRWVVSSNNREVMTDPNYYPTVLKMSPEVRYQLVSQAFDMAIAAGQEDKDGFCLWFEVPDSRMNPLMLDIDPKNPDDANVIVGDFGIDLVQKEGDQDDVTRRNVRAVYQFLNKMIGYFDDIPNNHPASKYSDCFSKGEWEGIKGQKEFFESYFLGHR